MPQTERRKYSDLELGLGRALTEVVSPDEAPYFDDIIATATRAEQKRGDHELGFGIPTEDFATVSAAILFLCKPILEFVWQNARDAAGKLIKDATDEVRLEFERRLFDWIKRRLRKPRPVLVPHETLEVFIETMRKDANEAGLDREATDRLIATLIDGFGE
jgi:hypothetical protein